MKADTYTKGLLTVIAACLVWMCLNGITPAAQAQGARSEPTRVVLVDANGNAIKVLPVMVANQAMTVQVANAPLAVAVANQSLAVAVSNPSLPVTVHSIQRSNQWDPIEVRVLREPNTPMPTP